MYSRPHDWRPWSWWSAFSCRFSRLSPKSRGASFSRSWRCCAWITWQSGSIKCIWGGSSGVFSRSSTSTWFSTFAGFRSLAKSFSGSESPFLVFALIINGSSFPSIFFRAPSARCSSFWPIHFTIVFFAIKLVTTTFAWSGLRFIIWVSFPFLTWPISIGFIF